MSDLLAARGQMAVSLGFHIVFAAVGIAMPLFMTLAEWRWRRTRDPTWLALARNWSKGTAVFFAVGAVSGTVLSFELGLLWPGFMRYAGGIIGMPFSLEGFAFFTEAIFLGIYLYGWQRVPARVHLAAGAVVAVSGAASALFVLSANAWMNAPAGFRLDALGHPVDVDPVAAMFGPAWRHEVIHMTLAAYQAVAAAVAAIHAAALLRDRANAFHRKALALALWVLVIASPLQIVAGDFSAGRVAVLQPAKLAALEGQFRTERGAPLRIGGLPDPATRTTPHAIEIPRGLSLLAFRDPNATVRGLESFPRDEWPNTRIVHVAFQVMVGCGVALLGVSVLAAWFARRRRGLPDVPWFLRLVVCAGPLGVLAIEAGWTVTEMGRQPWVIYGIQRTADAVTPMPGLCVPFATITLLYLFLGAVVLWLLRKQVGASPRTVAREAA